jgi:hypothetical protein
MRLPHSTSEARRVSRDCSRLPVLLARGLEIEGGVKPYKGTHPWEVFAEYAGDVSEPLRASIDNEISSDRRFVLGERNIGLC